MILTVGKTFFYFVIPGFRSLELEFAHASEINHDIHLANTLFLDKGSLEKIWLSFPVVYNGSF